MQKNKILISMVTLAVLALAGCGQKNSTPDGKLRVVTSFYPLYYFSSVIAGDKAVIRNITPAGAEPHDYEPTSQDIVAIEDSQLLILNGVKLESWAAGIKDRLSNGTQIITVGDALANRKIKDGGNITVDPHVWLDPTLAKQEVVSILEGFLRVDPSNQDYYKANAAMLLNQLDMLDANYSVGLEDCRTRDLVTSHAAFGYLANRYKLNQVAISGLSPDEEPSAKRLAEIAEYAKKNNVEYIFFESLTSPKLAQVIAEEVGAKTVVLNPLEGLSLEEINAGKNYQTVMRDNLANLRIALSCK